MLLTCSVARPPARLNGDFRTKVPAAGDASGLSWNAQIGCADQRQTLGTAATVKRFDRHRSCTPAAV